MSAANPRTDGPDLLGLTASVEVPPAEPPATVTDLPPDGTETATGPEGDLCWLLFRLAGRIPDEATTIARTCLGDGEWIDAIDVLASALTHNRPELTDEEAEVATELLRGSGFTTAELDQAERISELPPTGFRFTRPPGDGPPAELVDAVVTAGTEIGGLRAIWRAHRESAADAAGVWVVEADEYSNVIEMTAEIQHRLASAGEVPPRVELIFPDEDLPPYHDAAVSGGVLVWVRADLPAPQVARSFDGTDAHGKPYFDPGHRRLEGDERDRVLAYLTGAEMLLEGYSLMDDVLDPSAEGSVPLGFRSDGSWVWTDSVAHYLKKYGLAPDPELLAHILARQGGPEPLMRLQAHQAMVVLFGGPSADEPPGQADEPAEEPAWGPA